MSDATAPGSGGPSWASSSSPTTCCRSSPRPRTSACSSPSTRRPTGGAQPSPARRARPGRPGRPPAGPALGRAAPAGGRGPGARPPPPDDPRRRADRLPRRRHVAPCCSTSSSARSRAAGATLDRRHPRRGGRGPAGPHGRAARRRIVADTAAARLRRRARLRLAGPGPQPAPHARVAGRRRRSASGCSPACCSSSTARRATMTQRAVAPLAIDMQRVLTSPLGRRLTFTEELSARLAAAGRRRRSTLTVANERLRTRPTRSS